MTLSENTIDWVGRYVREVGAHLPRRIRDDVEEELRSLLEDSIEERTRNEPGADRNAVALEVIRAFGAPRCAAARYNPHPRSLIGPGLFPLFAKLFAITQLLVFAVPVFEFAVASGAPNFVEIAVSFATAALLNFGILVAVFAVVERITRAQPAATEAGWDPRLLPEVNRRDAVERNSMVAGIYVGFVLLVALHFAWPRLNFDVRLPVVPLTVLWASAIVLNTVVLRHGRWNRATRAVQLCLGLLAIGCLYSILKSIGPATFPAEAQAAKVGLGIGIASLAIKVAIRSYKLLGL